MDCCGLLDVFVKQILVTVLVQYFNQIKHCPAFDAAIVCPELHSHNEIALAVVCCDKFIVAIGSVKILYGGSIFAECSFEGRTVLNLVEILNQS